MVRGAQGGYVVEIPNYRIICEGVMDHDGTFQELLFFTLEEALREIACQLDYHLRKDCIDIKIEKKGGK